jgi:predicted dehydrogenase
MGIKELIGMESERKIRYAIVGLGDIAQEDMMPGVDHTGNSEITALITSDPVKANELGKKYGVEAVFSYEQFPEALTSGTVRRSV